MRSPKEVARAFRRRVPGNRRPYFRTADVEVGAGATFGRNVRFNCQTVRIGTGVRFQDDITIDVEDFSIGDFGTVYEGFFAPGPGSLHIGPNFWAGSHTIVDGQGSTTISANVGIGAHSQLWTHMIFGDTLVGSRFHSVSPLNIGHDVWFVGHCLVSPIVAEPFSLAMLGSVVTRDMKYNRTYAGVPAADLTSRLGPPVARTEPESRADALLQRVSEFARRMGVDVTELCRIVVDDQSSLERSGGITVFDVAHRNYAPTGTDLERALMRHLLPEAKFVPYPETCSDVSRDP